MTNSPCVSAVMCTYGRFECVQRAINCFLYQSYPNKQLIVYNTDVDSPYNNYVPELLENGVVFINNNIDKLTGEPYTNVGAIRRDALWYATGDYVVTWDDDDIFLPWFMQQAIDRMAVTGLPSFKPEMSFFYSGYLRLVRNTLEASVIADIKKVTEYGYLLETGKEGLAWYTKMRDNKELDEHDKYYLPSYCFNWGDGNEMKAPHKQSGDINNPNNFENHKAASNDYVMGRIPQIQNRESMDNLYRPYFSFIKDNATDFPKELLERHFNHLTW